jgi:hypothetical protein
MRKGTPAKGCVRLALLFGSLYVAGCGGSGDDSAGPSAASGGSSGAGSGVAADSGQSGGAGGGAGGTSDAGPTMMAVDKCASGAMKAATAGILNFEKGLGNLFVFADSTNNGGTTTPLVASPAGGILTGGPDGHFFEFKGDGFKKSSYGGGLGVSMNCTDASGATGLSFWMKSSLPVTVQVNNQADDPVSNSGLCVGDFSSCAQNSYKQPAVADWTKVAVSWAQFTGGKPNAAVDIHKIVSVGFVINPPADATDTWTFDVALDDVEWGGLPQGGDAGAGAGAADGGGVADGAGE